MVLPFFLLTLNALLQSAYIFFNSTTGKLGVGAAHLVPTVVAYAEAEAEAVTALLAWMIFFYRSHD
jgi:hypothetical protein